MESRADVNDMHASIFQVESFDASGQRHRSARLEVTNSNLVLYNKNKMAIRWPLRCLRRYGFDGETFTFESGRRCTTGPGIYTYRCRRAQDLFNMLQLKIQRIAEQSLHQDQQQLTALIPDDYLSPISANNRLRSDSLLASGGPIITPAVPQMGVLSAILPAPAVVSPPSSGGAMMVHSPVASLHTPVSPANGRYHLNNLVLVHDNLNEVEVGSSAPPSTPAHDDTRSESVGSVWFNCNDKTVTYLNSNDATLPHASSNSHRPISSSSMNFVDRGHNFVASASNTSITSGHSVVPLDSYDISMAGFNRTDIPDLANHVYMNIGTDNRRDLERLYANMGFDKDIPSMPPRLSLSVTTGSAGSGSSHSGTTTTTDTTQPNSSSNVNYIMVDIDKGSDSSQVPPFSPIGSITSALPESPPTRAVNDRYATIDFERTEALTKTAKMANCHANGGRHNSTFSGIIILPHHNSSYSE